jgi:hypothetical protein
MKDTLRTRLEFLWAKLAGRDVDIDTLTPDAPTNMVEKLMLETADRIGNAGGGGSMILALDNLPNPAIDGTPVADANIYVRNPMDESRNTQLPTDHIFVYDFPEGDYPLFLTKKNGEDPGVNSRAYDFAEQITSFECRAAKTVESGTRAAPTESPCLLNDVTVIQYYTPDDEYYFFPTTAQFGRRQPTA